MRLFVIGHKSPDLDSIASSVAYAEFLKKSKRYEEMDIIPLRAGDPNQETKYIFEKFGAELPKSIDEFEITPEDNFILVDHNTGRQRHDKIPEDQIVEIADHHKINVNVASPVRVDVKPFGSTSTLIYEHFTAYKVKASKRVESLILSAILSDTQGLKSSTTTGYDSKVAQDLAKSLGIDLDGLTFEIFREKANIADLTPLQIAKRDYKIYDFGDKKVFINQIETAETDRVLEKKVDLIKGLEEAKVEKGVDLGFLILTDIMHLNSQIIYVSDEEKRVIEEAFVTEGKGNVANIGPKMSRKKDIAPAIEKALTN